MCARWIGVVAAVLLLAAPSYARGPGNPGTWELRRAGVELRNPPELRLPLADPLAFLEQHRDRLGAHKRAVRGLAPQGFEAFDASDECAWEELPGGGAACRLSIRSPSAGSHILVFSDVRLPAGGRLTLYAPAATHNLTHCAHSCYSVTGADVAEGVMTTPMIAGEEIALEYNQPAMPVPGQAETAPVLRVASVMQGLTDSLHMLDMAERRRRRLLGVGRRLAQAGGISMGSPARPAMQPVGPLTPALAPAPPYVPGTAFRVDLLQQRADKLSSCTPSVECNPELSQVSKAVIDIYAINLSMGAMALCTGTIINAPMNRKYVLTADHCFVDKKQINNFRYWLLIFNYEVPCGATVSPPITDVIQGATLKFYDSRADVLLLSIPNVIPDHYKSYELGYDARDDVLPTSGYAIHHPAGNIARISSYNQSAGSISTNFTAANFPPGEIQPNDATHFEVRWGQGATEGGSSGSPLIDANSGRVVGVLTGGFSNCMQPMAPDYYGRLSKAWAGGLEYFLSTDPPQQLVASVADTLSQSMDGDIVVRSHNGSKPLEHGPGLAFYPSVINLSPGHHNATFSYYLSDAPRPGETIRMNMTVNGMEPGNTWDVTPHLVFSATNDNFTAGDSRRRNITLSLTGVDSSKFKAGDMVRFLLIFELTSDQDPNYMHIHTLKGIGQHQLGPWTQYQPVLCEPCNLDQVAISALNATQPNATGLAIFQRVADRPSHDSLDVCLRPGVLRTATISAYINGVFSWTACADAYGDPNCLHIPGLMLEQGNAYTLVVSDRDDLDAVLPASVVHSLKVSPVEAESQERKVSDANRLHLGPTMAGPTREASATKSLRFSLPPDASAAGTSVA
ncbi:hypothetical protein WJX81_005389 [Elliptochloris bilobata]|uniref:Peptidase S1 domain-containing protein n=1 Tax=Elliptochloris bilobata TaxID=381761 RepID=A0AAW1RKK5_9CHLO